MTVSVSLAVGCIVVGDSGAPAGRLDTGLRYTEVVPVVNEAPLLGATPLSQSVVPETME